MLEFARIYYYSLKVGVRLNITYYFIHSDTVLTDKIRDILQTKPGFSHIFKLRNNEKSVNCNGHSKFSQYIVSDLTSTQFRLVLNSLPRRLVEKQ